MEPTRAKQNKMAAKRTRKKQRGTKRTPNGNTTEKKGRKTIHDRIWKLLPVLHEIFISVVYPQRSNVSQCELPHDAPSPTFPCPTSLPSRTPTSPSHPPPLTPHLALLYLPLTPPPPAQGGSNWKNDVVKGRPARGSENPDFSHKIAKSRIPLTTIITPPSPCSSFLPQSLPRLLLSLLLPYLHRHTP